MGKPQYRQRYSTEWEKCPELKDWIMKSTGDNTAAFCKFCKTNVACRLADLRRHAKTDKHVTAAKPFSCQRQQKINFPKLQVNEKAKAEAKLALYCASHTSLLAIDHLCETCNTVFPEAKAVPIQIHRTKCTGIIVNILGPNFKKQLIEDIGDSFFSLIVDESTDVAIMKLLGLVIKYYSAKSKKFFSTYLALIHITDGTSETIAVAIKELLSHLKLKFCKLVGIGTDNASVMTGTNNGVFEKLKVDLKLPNLILVRCICHSLQLALSAATERTLPRNIDFLIRETYNWFKNSSKRQIMYENIFKTLNDGKAPLKIVQLAQTRWISMEPAVKRILDQYVELKTHFEIVRRTESCYTAELLYNMYSDPVTKVYLDFLYPILEEVQRVNKNFESKTADPTKLHQDLINLVNSLAKRVINPTSYNRIDILTIENFDSYLNPSPYLGYSFENACKENNISVDQKDTLKKRCFNFSLELLRELRARLPSNLKIFSNINVISVTECLRVPKMPITELAKSYFSDVDVTKIEYQWNNLSTIKWIEQKNTLDFWIEVSNYRDASGDTPFHELVELAMLLLVLPLSNADVERVFSQVNCVKTKLRNRMGLNTLDNVLLIRFGLRRLDVCCNKYEVPTEVLKAIGTMATYAKNSDETEAETDIIDILL